MPSKTKVQIVENGHCLNVTDNKKIVDNIKTDPDVKLMQWISDNIQGKHVNLHSSIRESIQTELDISSATLERSIKSLKDSGVLLKDENSTNFKVNTKAIKTTK